MTPNWKTPVQVTVSYRTDIVTSRSGKEQRRALRASPRRSLSFGVTVAGDDRREFVTLLTRQQAAPLTIADPTRDVMLAGRLGASITASHPVSRAAEIAVTFDVDPGSEPAPSSDAGLQIHAGREVFVLRPNWSSPVEEAFEWPVETLDYGSGRVRTSTPITEGWFTQQAAFVGATPEETAEIEAFFSRMKGRRGEFYMPTGTDDIGLLATTAAGSRVLTTTATARDQGAIAIKMSDGRLLFRTVVSVTSSGVMTVVAPFLSDLRPADVDYVSWMPIFRFASDDVTFEWQTASVAQVQLSMRSLPEAPPERPLPAYDGAAQWVLENWGADILPWFSRFDYAVNVLYPKVFINPIVWRS